MKYFDIGNNTIEDKGAVAIGKWLAGSSVGLVHLDLSNCGFSKQGIFHYFSTIFLSIFFLYLIFSFFFFYFSIYFLIIFLIFSIFFS